MTREMAAAVWKFYIIDPILQWPHRFTDIYKNKYFEKCVSFARRN